MGGLSPGTPPSLLRIQPVLRFFAEMQKDSRDTSSTIDAALVLRARSCLSCPCETFTADGSVEDARFEASATRVHWGLGYRIRLGSESHLEVTAGASHFSLKQELAQRLEQGGDDCSRSPRTARSRSTSSGGTARRARAGASTCGPPSRSSSRRRRDSPCTLRYSKAGELDFEGLEAFDEGGDDYRTEVKVKTGGLAAEASLRFRF